MNCSSRNMCNHTICYVMHMTCIVSQEDCQRDDVFIEYSNVVQWLQFIHRHIYPSHSKCICQTVFFALSVNVCNLKYNNSIEKSLHILAHYIIITNTFSELYFSFYPLHRIECLLNTKIMLQFLLL